MQDLRYALQQGVNWREL